VLLAGALLPPVDFFIVNVALPSMREGLAIPASQAQLILSGYAASYAVFLVTGGRLGDLYGRRLSFALGVGGFTLASLVCGVATSGIVLVAGRLLQGLSAAALVPQALGSIRALFAGPALGRALSFYGITIGLGSVAGQFLGGALTQADLFGLGWRLVFLVNLPIGALTVALTYVLIPETSAAERPRLDLGGAALMSLALAAIVVPLSEGRERGWPWWSLAMLGAAPVLAWGFLAWEGRVARRGGMPILDPALLRLRAFRRYALVAGFFFWTTAFYMLFGIYQQEGMGDDPLHTGLGIMPYGIGLFLGNVLSSPLPRGWLRGSFLAGFGAETVGYGLIAAALYVQAPHWAVTAALLFTGFSQGVALPRLFTLSLMDVPPAQAGVAAGVVNMMLQIGAAVSAAGIASVFFGLLGGGHGAAAYGEALGLAMGALVAGLGVAWVIAAAR
jgi:MFS family permease